jgi:DNA polymerase-3 subunit gamma/tau
VGDGADPRQFGREVVEYLRGLLLIKQGAGTRLLNATAEQATDMEATAERVPIKRLLRAIHLFNEAVTDVKSGLQVIPQLPLEMALVESILETAAPEVLTGPPAQQSPTPPASSSPPPVQPKPRVHRVAEQPDPSRALSEAEGVAGEGADPSAPSPAPTADVEAGAPAEAEPIPEPLATAGLPTLEQVEGAWDQVLQEVRQRNPMTQGLLNTGCTPADVQGNEIVVTFPYPFLREKLQNLQRKMEIQDALSAVLGTKCSVKLVLASDYTPHQRTSSAVPATSPDQTPALGNQALDKISEWAAERGGQTTVVQS